MKALRSVAVAAVCLPCMVEMPGVAEAAEAAKAEEAPWMRTLTPITQPQRGPEKAIPPLEGTAKYTFGWSGLVAAKGELRFSEVRPGMRRMDLSARTVGGVRTLWRLDAVALSEVNATTFLPLRVRQWEKYRSRNVITALQFVPGGVLHSKGRIKGDPPPAFFRDTGEKEPIDKDRLRSFTGERARKFKFSPLLDAHAALLWVRQQPLKSGERFQLVIFQENSAYLARVRVRQRETITVRGVRRAAIPLDISLEWIDDDKKLQPHTKFKSATGWYSDDADRVPLKLEVEIFVGRIWAELESFSKPPVASGSPADSNSAAESPKGQGNGR